MPTGVSEGMDEEWASHQHMQTILSTVRRRIIAVGHVCSADRLGLAAPPGRDADATTGEVAAHREELDRDLRGRPPPFFTLWIDRSESRTKKLLD